MPSLEVGADQEPLHGALTAVRTLQLPQLKDLLNLSKREIMFWREPADLSIERIQIAMLLKFEEKSLRQVFRRTLSHCFRAFHNSTSYGDNEEVAGLFLPEALVPVS